MSNYDEELALEIAIINLVTAIQKGDRSLDDLVSAVSDAAKRLPNWKLEIYEEVK